MDRSQIVAPNIFDALAEPDVLLPLVMANTMSPRLWRLGRKVARADDPLEAARRVVDTSFTHARPEDTAAVSGVLNLDAERRRIGADVVDRAIADIDRGWDERRERGLLGPDDRLQDEIAAGRYPAYVYANVDVINAARRVTGGPARRPRGLTSCMDEAALFSALIMTAPAVTARLDGIVLLVSSLHYTVFGWTGPDGWWFWSKRDLFPGSSFGERVDRDHRGDAADAFSAVMSAPLRRVVSRRGHLDLDAHTSSLPPDELERTIAAIEAFFRHRPHGLEDLGDLRFTSPSAHDVLFDEAVRCGSANEVHDLIRRHQAAGGETGAAATEALLAFRSLEVDDLRPYLEAARRGPLVADRAAGLRSAQDAIAVAADPADGPALGDPSRLALPDEILARGTCSPAERAVLLHVLLERAGAESVRTELIDGDAVTRTDAFAVRASDLARLDPDTISAAGPALAHGAAPDQQ